MTARPPPRPPRLYSPCAGKPRTNPRRSQPSVAARSASPSQLLPFTMPQSAQTAHLRTPGSLSHLPGYSWTGNQCQELQSKYQAITSSSDTTAYIQLVQSFVRLVKGKTSAFERENGQGQVLNKISSRGSSSGGTNLKPTQNNEKTSHRPNTTASAMHVATLSFKLLIKTPPIASTTNPADGMAATSC
eukprot:scaffold2408_cov386-Prasinococcus_capsulatus_cf.AAC.15